MCSSRTLDWLQMLSHLRGAFASTGKPVLLSGNPFGNEKDRAYLDKYHAGPF